MVLAMFFFIVRLISGEEVSLSSAWSINRPDERGLPSYHHTPIAPCLRPFSALHPSIRFTHWHLLSIMPNSFERRATKQTRNFQERITIVIEADVHIFCAASDDDYAKNGASVSLRRTFTPDRMQLWM